MVSKITTILLVGLISLFLLCGCTQTATTPPSDKNGGTTTTQDNNTLITTIPTPVPTQDGNTLASVTSINPCDYLTQDLITSNMKNKFGVSKRSTSAYDNNSLSSQLNSTNQAIMCIYTGTPLSDRSLAMVSFVTITNINQAIIDDLYKIHVSYGAKDLTGIGDKSWGSGWGTYPDTTSMKSMFPARAIVYFVKNGQLYYVVVNDSTHVEDNLPEAEAVAKAIAPKLP